MRGLFFRSNLSQVARNVPPNHRKGRLSGEPKRGSINAHFAVLLSTLVSTFPCIGRRLQVDLTTPESKRCPLYNEHASNKENQANVIVDRHPM